MTEVKAELVGNVWKVKTEPGAHVAEEDELLILESMKMEIPVTAPRAGTVKEVRVKELMSGRIRNPTELIQMNQEVQHMKASFAEEEEAELRLMEEAELAEQAVLEASERLQEARTRSASDEPALRRDLESWQAELASVKTDSDAAWAQVEPTAQRAYLRVRAHPPVAEVDRNQCQECHVTVTSSGMQLLRKGDAIVQCENCGRILVMA